MYIFETFILSLNTVSGNSRLAILAPNLKICSHIYQHIFSSVVCVKLISIILDIILNDIENKKTTVQINFNTIKGEAKCKQAIQYYIIFTQYFIKMLLKNKEHSPFFISH